MSYNIGAGNHLTSTQKLRQEIVLKLNDGNIFLGRIFLGFNERILDMLNDDRKFIPIELDTKNVILIAKNSIVSVDLFQQAAENASKFDNIIQNSCLYTNKNVQSPQIIDKNNSEYQKNIYNKYMEIINVLQSDIFKEKITQDTKFEDSVLEILNLLQQLSEIIEIF